MRISDWSSDVCSSDLRIFAGRIPVRYLGRPAEDGTGSGHEPESGQGRPPDGHRHDPVHQPLLRSGPHQGADMVSGAPQSRSEEHTSELQSLMRISYAVFCLKKKHNNNIKLDQLIHNTNKKKY